MMTIQTELKRFSSDTGDYIGLLVKMPAKPDSESEYKPPACLSDLPWFEFFGTKVKQGNLRVAVFGFFSDDDQRLCADLSETAFGSLALAKYEGEITVELVRMPGRKKIAVSKTARTPNGVYIEKRLIYVSPNRLWMIQVSYPDNDVSAKAAANSILDESSIELEVEQP